MISKSEYNKLQNRVDWSKLIKSNYQKHLIKDNEGFSRSKLIMFLRRSNDLNQPKTGFCTLP